MTTLIIRERESLQPPPNLKLQTHPPPPAATLIPLRLKNLPHPLNLLIAPPPPQLPPLRLQGAIDGRHDLVAEHGEEFEGVAAAARREDEVRAVWVRGYEEVAAWPIMLGGGLVGFKGGERNRV